MQRVTKNKKNIQGKPLVSLIADQTETLSNQGPLSKQVEAAFHLPDYRGLRLDTQTWSEQAASFYAARSARTPENLLNHVQRVIHQIQLKNSEGIYGALLDLFIVLKSRGKPLRIRMLKSAKPLLKAEWFEQLNLTLDKGITELNTMPLSRFSILSKGCRGTQPLVEKIDS